MAKVSVPAGYKVTNTGSGIGVTRKTSKGESWVIQPFCAKALVAKTCGRIIIAYISNMDMAQKNRFFRMVDFKGKPLIQEPVYDVIFGEHILYVLVQRGIGLAWCYTKDCTEAISDLQPLGNYTFGERKLPAFVDNHYISLKSSQDSIRMVAQEEIQPDADGNPREPFMKLNMGEVEVVANKRSSRTGLGESYSKQNARVAVQPTYADDLKCRYSVTDKDQLVFLDSSGKEVAKTKSLMGLADSADILGAILGAADGYTYKQAKCVVDGLNKFEMGQSIMHIVMLVLYTCDRNAHGADKMRQLIANIDKSWVKEPSGQSEFQAYIVQNNVLVLAKIPNSGILMKYIIPYVGEEAVYSHLSEDTSKALVGATESGAEIGARVKLDKVIKVQSPLNKDKLPLPTSVASRPLMVKDIKKHSYGEVDGYVLRGSMQNKTTGGSEPFFGLINIAGKFTYTSATRGNNTPGSGIQTNTGDIFTAELVAAPEEA